MFSWIKSKLNIKVNSQMIKPLLIAIFAWLLYLILCLYNFSIMEFTPEQLKNSEFWVRYSISVGFSFIMLILASMLRKEVLKRQPMIVNQLEHISALRALIIEKGLYSDFSNVYLKQYNKEIKLAKYRDMILRKRDKAKNEATRAKYDTIYNSTFAENFNIDNVSVKIEQVTVNLLFFGLANGLGQRGQKVKFTGWEKFVTKVVPTVICGYMIFAIIFLTNIYPAETNIETIKSFVSITGMMISYMLSGISYADFSINDVYYAVLQNREDIAKEYLTSKGLTLFIQENPNYKYKVIEKPEEKEVGNGDLQQ